MTATHIVLIALINFSISQWTTLSCNECWWWPKSRAASAHQSQPRALMILISQSYTSYWWTPESHTAHARKARSCALMISGLPSLSLDSNAQCADSTDCLEPETVENPALQQTLLVTGITRGTSQPSVFTSTHDLGSSIVEQR